MRPRSTAFDNYSSLFRSQVNRVGLRANHAVRWTVALFAGLLVLAGSLRLAMAADNRNLLLNGDLSQGEGAVPKEWQSDAWQKEPEASTFIWRSAGDHGELEISSLKPNDARWIQKVHLEPGWYHLTANARADDVARNATGVNLGLLEDGVISEQLQGNTDWKNLGLYLKIGSLGADVIVACRLGGFAGLNTGKAFFRNVRLVKLESPLGSADKLSFTYDLDFVRNIKASAAVTPSSEANFGPVMILFVLAITLLMGLFVSSESGKLGLRKILSALRAAGAPGPLAPERKIPAPSVQRRTEAALFLVCFGTFVYFYQASDHSGASRIDLIRAIAERHTLWIDGYAGYNTADLVQADSQAHIYSNKAPGGALTGIFPWLLVTSALRLVTSPSSAFYWTTAVYLTTLLSINLIAALMAVLMYRFALLWGVSNFRALALGLTLAFGTIMFPHATEFTAEPIAAFCELAAFYLLALPQAGEDSSLKILFAGLLAGWGVLCDYPSFLIAITVAGYAIWKLGTTKRILVFVAAAAAAATLLMAYNKLAFGTPFFLSYEAYMLPGADRFPEQAKGFAGVTYPRLSVLYRILVDPQRGILFCNPVLLLLIPGLYFFWRKQNLRAEFATIAIAIISFTALNASYGESIIYWGGGTATGPRHLAPVLPFIVLALAFLTDRLNWLFGVLGLASAFLMLMATAVEPHLPYEYANPFRDFLWPAFLRGDFGLNSSRFFAEPLASGDSAAFNLGKLAGLPGGLQLWPLGALWIAVAFYLMRGSEPPQRRSGARVLQLAALFGILALFAPPTIGSMLAAKKTNATQGLLGCYYRGLRPNTAAAAHIRRVDSQISFDSIAELGALPSPSSVVWRGTILAPINGQYQFAIQVDDLGWLKVDNKTVIADPGNVTKATDSGSVELTAGEHVIEVGERNIWGGASMQLNWQLPGGVLRPVPPQFLIPDQGECRPG